MPAPSDLLELPFLRDALVEVVLLAVAGGMVGAWVVLRRLAFFSHAVGSATFPGLVTADATGISPTLLGLAVALGYSGGVSRTARGGRDAAEGTALLLVAALGTGVILASDVFESGAGVDRLLFGTLLGLDCSDLWLSGACAAVAAAPLSRSGGRGAPSGSIPTGPPSLGLPVAALDLALLALVALTAVAALPAVGALLVGAVFVLPAAAARVVARQRPGLVAWALAIGLAEAVVGLYLAYWLDAPPGPPIAVLGAATYGVLAMAAALGRRGARWRHERHRGSWPVIWPWATAGRPALTRASRSPPRRAARCACWDRTAAARPRCSASCSARSGPEAGELGVEGRPAYLAQSERTRLDFPVSAADVALMGTLAAGRWWRPPGRGAARGGPRGARAAWDSPIGAQVPFGELSGGERRRALLARTLVQDAPVLLLDEPLAGVDPASAALISRVFGELRAEGRTLLVSTHDVAAAHEFDLVLCLNRRQVAFGPPAGVLSRETLERTYGHELIVLGPGRTDAAVVRSRVLDGRITGRSGRLVTPP